MTMETFTVHVINVKILPYARIVEKTCVYLDNLVPRAVPLKREREKRKSPGDEDDT